jgi:NADH:ubiquinone oxidoreductase subunit 6 (subunit J)
MFIIYWIGIFLVIFGAISFVKITDENETREEALKKVALIVMIAGAILLAAAQPVLNWNQMQKEIETNAAGTIIH